jgi:hypothetical protein
MARAPDPDAVVDEAAVVELRRYALHPGAQERLITLFDREFVETQEAVGMRVINQFRDVDAPDTFVWFRGFSGMEARTGVANMAALSTEASANTYPRLPVREGEHVLVTLLRLDSAADHAGSCSSFRRVRLKFRIS